MDELERKTSGPVFGVLYHLRKLRLEGYVSFDELTHACKVVKETHFEPVPEPRAQEFRKERSIPSRIYWIETFTPAEWESEKRRKKRSRPNTPGVRRRK